MIFSYNNTIKISDYINTNYREYSVYINNARAIPSVVDGFKPVQRKAIYTAMKACRNDFIKVSSLSGAILNLAAYHHGDASAQDAVILMAQDFNNNIPFLDQDGSFGTRLSPTASAGRYIYAKMSERFFDIFQDTNLAPRSPDESDHPEPLYYLPVIPTVLLNGTSGIAVGFATNILPRSAKTLASGCIEYLKKGKVSNLPPYQEGFHGTFSQDPDGTYNCHGKVERISKTKVLISEVPLGVTHEKYQEFLFGLRDKGSIVSFVDNSDSRFSFEVTMPRANTMNDEQLARLFKIARPMKENIVVVDDFAGDAHDRSSIAIRTYESAEVLLKEFVDFRLKYYAERITWNINRLNEEVSLNKDKIRFINAVLSKKIKIGDLTRKDLIQFMKDSKYTEEHIEKIITMSIYNMTKDNMDALQAEIDTKEAELKMWGSCNAKDLYIKDLELIKKKYN